MPGYGFPRKLRLTDPAQFTSVFKQAEFKVSNHHFLVLAITNQMQYGRLGVVIGKKKLPKAFQRNRIKRQLRNSFRLNQELLVGLDIVILARSNLSSLSNKQIAEIIRDLWCDLVKKSNANPHNPTDQQKPSLVPQ